MSEYYYQCFDCEKNYSREEIENNFIYLCPVCGKVQKNTPLKGILRILYDYDTIKKYYLRENFLKLTPGKFWHYDYLWPIDSDDSVPKGIPEEVLKRIALPADPLLRYTYNNREILLLDDSRNPTLSYKDRASSLVVIKAVQMGITLIAAASTGNAGSSLAGLCARMGMSAVVFVPKNIPEAKRLQIQSYGAQLVMVDGDYDLAFDTCMEIATKKKLFNRNTAYNPLTIEGKKSAAYDIFISTQGKIPDMIFIPCGDGVILSGIYKGFWELKELGWIDKIPKLVAVQAEGSKTIVRYFRTNRFIYKEPRSLADSICAGAPRALYPANQALLKSCGDAIEVSDQEILKAQYEIAHQFGILVEPSCAAAFAGYKKYFLRRHITNESCLIMLTGNGLKDAAVLSRWNDPVIPLSNEEIRNMFR